MKTKEIIPHIHDFINSNHHARSYKSITRVSKKKLADGCIERCFFTSSCVYIDVITDPLDNLILCIKISDRSLKGDYHHLLYFYAEKGDFAALEIMDIASKTFPLDDKSIPIKAAYASALGGGNFSLAESIARNSEYLNTVDKIYKQALPYWILQTLWKFDDARIKDILSFMQRSFGFDLMVGITVPNTDTTTSLFELINDGTFFDDKTRKAVIKANQTVFE